MEAGLPQLAVRAYAHECRILSAKFRRSHLRPRHQRIRRFRPGYDSRDRSPRLNLGVRWDLQTFFYRRAPFESSVPTLPARSPSSPTIRPARRTRLLLRKNTSAGCPRRIRHLLRPHSSDLQLGHSDRQRHHRLPGLPQQHELLRPPGISQLPNALVSCPLTFTTCSLPTGFTEGVTHDLSAFAPNFVTPRVQQARLTFRKRVVEHTTVSFKFLTVHGEHLIRALDVNLPSRRLRPIPSSIPPAPFSGRLLHRRFLRHLAVHRIAHLPVSAMHQSSRPAHRSTRRHQRISKRSFELLQRSYALHQSPRLRGAYMRSRTPTRMRLTMDRTR